MYLLAHLSSSLRLLITRAINGTNGSNRSNRDLLVPAASCARSYFLKKYNVSVKALEITLSILCSPVLRFVRVSDAMHGWFHLILLHTDSETLLMGCRQSKVSPDTESSSSKAPPVISVLPHESLCDTKQQEVKAALAAEAKHQQEEKAALAAEAKHQQGLLDEMKPLALSGPAVVVSKTSDAPLSKATDPIVPLSVETPLIAKRGEWSQYPLSRAPFISLFSLQLSLM
jgi:hypothetical protein